MKTSVRKKIVKILESDGNLLLNWREFFDELDLEIADYVRLNDHLKKGTLTHYELFSDILNIWVSANSELDLDTQIQKLIQVLKNNGSNLVAEKLQKAFEILNQTDDKVPIWFEVGKATKNFVGRKKVLKRLKKMFNKPDELVVTITGMGGVGKSELAKSFAKRMTENCKDCIWLNGDSQESLKNSIIRLENFLHLHKPGEKEQSETVDFQFHRIITSSKKKSRFLVIIDNVDDANEDVQKLISKTREGRCFFVVTSRNVSILDYAGTIVELTTLSDEAAIDLIKQSGINEPDDQMIKLCSLLGNFPLALHQATAYIKMQKRISVKGQSFLISDYLKIYETQKRTLLDHKLNLIEHEYKETTLFTWNISFEKIQKDEKLGDTAIQLLNTIAYFQPDGIEVEFLNLYQKDLVEAIPLVKTYSLVKVENGVISIHRLIQQVIRLNLTSYQLEIQHLTKILTAIQPLLQPAEQFVGLYGYIFPEDYEESSVDKELTIKHIEIGICHIVSVLKYAAKHIQVFSLFKNVFLEALNNLRYFESYQQIIELCNATLYQLDSIQSLNTELTLQIETEVAYAKCNLDSTGELNSKHLLELKNVYVKQKSSFGEQDKATLATAHYIAELEERFRETLNDDFAAENVQSCKKVVELKTKVFGSLHKSTFSTKLILTKYICCNRKDINMLEECFKWQVTNLGANRYDTLQIFENYFSCLIQSGKYELARSVVEQYLQQKFTLCKYDVHEKLSWILFCIGKTEDAFSMLTLANMSSAHPDFMISNFNSKRLNYKNAESLLKDGNYTDAMSLYKNLNIDQCEYNWWWVDINYKISKCLIGLNQLKEAINVLQNVMDCQFTLLVESKPIFEINKLLQNIKRQIIDCKEEPIHNMEI